MRDKLRTHKDLDVWKNAVGLAEELYAITAQFPKEEVYGLASQARRSAVSVPSNIAEGAARSSKKEFIQHLYVALGSAAELETQLILAQRMGFLRDSSVFDRVDQVRRMLVGLIDFLKRKPVTRHA
ncbi:MAG: four helix bundle protein [Nitrospiraceae bacterium]